jgi:aminoglycoside phosphotransferase (APT) family kinase protein
VTHPPSDPVPLSAPGILAVARAIAQDTGLSATDAQVIKFTNNAVVRLPHARVVLRIAGSPAIRRRLDTVLTAARLYADHGIPAVRLHPDLPNPVHALGRLASVWVDGYDPTVPTPRPGDLATMLRAIHAIPSIPATSAIPAWDPVGNIRRRIRSADGATDEDLAFLTRECDSLEAALRDLAAQTPLLPAGLIHGDAFLGNLVPARPHPLICDFDSTAVGALPSVQVSVNSGGFL